MFFQPETDPALLFTRGIFLSLAVDLRLYECNTRHCIQWMTVLTPKQQEFVQ